MFLPKIFHLLSTPFAQELIRLVWDLQRFQELGRDEGDPWSVLAPQAQTIQQVQEQGQPGIE